MIPSVEWWKYFIYKIIFAQITEKKTYIKATGTTGTLNWCTYLYILVFNFYKHVLITMIHKTTIFQSSERLLSIWSWSSYIMFQIAKFVRHKTSMSIKQRDKLWALSKVWTILQYVLLLTPFADLNGHTCTLCRYFKVGTYTYMYNK